MAKIFATALFSCLMLAGCATGGPIDTPPDWPSSPVGTSTYEFPTCHERSRHRSHDSSTPEGYRSKVRR